MSDLRSKLPDVKELGSMFEKFVKDVSKSVSEIVQEYKQKRATPEEPPVNQASPLEGEPPVVAKKTKTTSTTVENGSVSDEPTIKPSVVKKAAPRKPKKDPTDVNL